MPAKLSVTSFDYPESELIFGVVSPVGTDLSQLQLVLETHLRRFRYSLNRQSTGRIAAALAAS